MRDGPMRCGALCLSPAKPSGTLLYGGHCALDRYLQLYLYVRYLHGKLKPARTRHNAETVLLLLLDLDSSFCGKVDTGLVEWFCENEPKPRATRTGTASPRTRVTPPARPAESE